MPVPRVCTGKGANYSINSQALCDQWIIVNVDVVIEVNKIVPHRLTKDQPRDCGQQEVNQNSWRARQRLFAAR